MAIYKVHVIGDSGVGIAALCLRFQENKFLEGQPHIRDVTCMTNEKTLQHEQVTTQFWKQSNLKNMLDGYGKKYDGILFVYDISDINTFVSIKNKIKKMLDSRCDRIFILVGNKSDLIDERVVSSHEASDFAKANNMLFFETSALTGDNVETAFNTLINTIHCNKTGITITDLMNDKEKNTGTDYNATEDQLVSLFLDEHAKLRIADSKSSFLWQPTKSHLDKVAEKGNITLEWILRHAGEKTSKGTMNRTLRVCIKLGWLTDSVSIKKNTAPKLVIDTHEKLYKGRPRLTY